MTAVSKSEIAECCLCLMTADYFTTSRPLPLLVLLPGLLLLYRDWYETEWWATVACDAICSNIK